MRSAASVEAKPLFRILFFGNSNKSGLGCCSRVAIVIADLMRVDVTAHARHGARHSNLATLWLCLI
jgi:hypothetical protein